MRELIAMLDEGGYSCVIDNGGDIRCFTQRGVADLYRLYVEEPQYLSGAHIADKIVGKGAAALMAAGGVKRLYTHILSKGAHELLASQDVRVEYGELVDHIINRNGSDWCPVEKRCRDAQSVDAVLNEVVKFIKEQK